jgi:hypothetical protein
VESSASLKLQQNPELSIVNGSAIKRVETLEELQRLDMGIKVAKLQEKVFTRHAHAWSDGPTGGFVEDIKSMVSKYTIVPRSTVIAGDTDIDGYQTLEPNKIFQGTIEKPVKISAPLPTFGEIKEIAILMRKDETKKVP